MFNNHHLPKSLLNEVASVLNNTNADFDLPQVLQDVVAEAARDYVMCPTREDRKAIIEWHIEQVMSLDDVEQQTIVNFERAVEYTVMNENWMETLGTGLRKGARAVVGGVKGAFQGAVPHAQKSIQGAEDAVSGTTKTLQNLNKAAKTIDKNKDLKKGLVKAAPQLAAATQGAMKGYAGLKQSIGSGIRAIGGGIGGGVKGAYQGLMSGYDYSELLDVLASLNEEEFHAYIDLLSESEIQLLQQIINENNQ